MARSAVATASRAVDADAKNLPERTRADCSEKNVPIASLAIGVRQFRRAANQGRERIQNRAALALVLDLAFGL
jgi:hypothetical protein